MWHALYPVRSDDVAAHTIATFVEEGLSRDERVVLVLDAGVSQAVRDRLERRARPAAGAMRWLDVGAVYGEGGRIDAIAQLATFQRMLREALVDGYSGLRVAGDVTPVALQAPEDLLRWERTADAFEASSPVTGMCVIDARRVSTTVLEAVDVLHPATPLSIAAFHLHAGGRTTLALTGEIDAFGAELLVRTLRTLGSVFAMTPALDLLDVTFMSHQALRVLEQVAADVGTTIELRNMSPTIRGIASELPLDHLEVLG